MSNKTKYGIATFIVTASVALGPSAVMAGSYGSSAVKDDRVGRQASAGQEVWCGRLDRNIPASLAAQMDCGGSARPAVADDRIERRTRFLGIPLPTNRRIATDDDNPALRPTGTKTPQTPTDGPHDSIHDVDGPKDPNDGPKDPHDGPKDPNDGPKDPHDGPKDPNDGPKDPHDGPKEPHDGPKDPHDGPKEPHDGPKDPHDGPKEPHDGPKDPHDGPKDPHDGPKDPHDGPKDSHDGPKDPHDGPKDSPGSSHGPHGEKDDHSKASGSDKKDH